MEYIAQAGRVNIYFESLAIWGAGPYFVYFAELDFG
jgi:hypothetical protein